MCEICGQNPCHSKCPNSEYEPEVVHKCEECGADILEGDTYYEICGYTLCEHCVEKARKEAVANG